MGVHPIRKYVAPEIPDRLYFRIGDVAQICEVPPYVLRFWETEFPQLRPNKGGTGQRLYRKRDVAMALRIKSLLYDQGYTIPGARQVFKNEAKPRETAAPPVATMAQSDPVQTPAVTRPASAARSDELRRQAAFRAVRDELCALLVILEQPLSSSAEQGSKPASPRVHAMRPRLVVGPGAGPASADVLRPRTHAREQGDLFATE